MQPFQTHTQLILLYQMGEIISPPPRKCCLSLSLHPRFLYLLSLCVPSKALLVGWLDGTALSQEASQQQKPRSNRSLAASEQDVMPELPSQLLFGPGVEWRLILFSDLW
jgi:hypothetical protein